MIAATYGAPGNGDGGAALGSTRLIALWETPPTLWGWLTTIDHKLISRRYLVTAFLFLLAGGLEALLIRYQLVSPGRTALTGDDYNQLYTLHGMTMIFWYAAPVLSAFGNFLVPLLIGARDMAFPRLNALSYWAFLLSGLFLYLSVPLHMSPNAGWFAYAPLTLAAYSPGAGMDFYALSLIFLSVSTTVGAINFIVTICRLRAPGMSLTRMPLLMYSTMTTSVLVIVALPALSAACVMLLLERHWGFHFFGPAGGDPLLWQHLFWFFGHPWVYIIFLPATGMVSMLLPVYARRPIVGYHFVAWSTMLTGVAGLMVWVHHMFAAGVAHRAMSLFSAASMTISVFSTIQVFAWIATLWRGRPVLSTSLLFALGFIATFIVGGLSGVVTALIPVDWQLHDTYFVVGHIHYVLIGANLFPVLAALYHWFPKMTGRLLDERLGYWSVGLAFTGFNLGFFPMHIAGFLGMRRRVFSYAANAGLDIINLLVTIGAVVLALGLLLTLINVFVSLRRGRVASADPWHADTLEWSLPSPPPSYGFEQIPAVRSRHPLWDVQSDTVPPGPRLDDARCTLTTSFVHARVTGRLRMPGDSIAPLLVTLAAFAVCTAVLSDDIRAIAVAAGAVTVAVLVWLWPGRAEWQS